MWIPDPDPVFKDLALPGPGPDPVSNTRRVPETIKGAVFHKI